MLYLVFLCMLCYNSRKHVRVEEFFCDEDPIVLNLEERNVYFYCIDDQFTVNVSGKVIPIKEFLLSNDDAFSLIEENLQREEGPSDGGTQIYKSIKGSEFSSK